MATEESVVERTVKDIFNAWDLNQNAFIEKSELASCCSELNLTDEQLNKLFDDLDVDGDGKISITDFSQGFQRVCTLFEVEPDEAETHLREARKFDKLLDALGVSGLLSG